MLKICPCPLASSVILPVVGPVIVKPFAKSISLVSVIVPLSPSANVIVASAGATAIASRSEQSESHTPSLVSANLVTTSDPAAKARRGN